MTERFRADLARIRPGLLAGERLGLAVSGGPDSLAMLLLADAALPGRVAVATVDHGLRSESAEEAAMVARLCSKLGVPHWTLRVEVAQGNTQSQARDARYAAMAEWCAGEGLSALATAHHADDQAETFLMRANRASGVAGLTGIRAAGVVPGTDIPLLRPLLGWRREELGGIVETAGVAPALDPSNLDDRYDRVRMRQAIAGANWLDVDAIARTAANLADAEEVLRQAEDASWAERATVTENEVIVAPPVLRHLRFDCVSRALATIGKGARGEVVARLLDRLDAGEGGNAGGVLVRVRDGKWVFTPEPSRKS